MKKYTYLLISIISTLFYQNSLAQSHNNLSERIHKQQSDSLITTFTITEDGDTLYHFQAPVYGNKLDTSERRRLIEQVSHSKDNLPQQQPKFTVKSLSTATVDQSKSVGQIPFTEGITPSGGKIYAIPIMAAPVVSIAPQIAIAYNSQSGNGVAGYGWNLSGLSAITVCPKNIYYDGAVSPIDLSAPSSAAFMLDGIRLVPNTGSIPSYQYETAQGFILVKKNITGNGAVAYFDVLYPNGSKAIFGFTTNTQMRHIYPLTSLTDMKGYRIDFEYAQFGNNYYVSKIKYGGKTPTTHLAEITFQYTDRKDYTPIYLSNLKLEACKLLTKIISYNGGKELRTYDLTHTVETDIQRLSQVDCKVGNSALNPLVFRYETYYPNDKGALTVDKYGAFLKEYFSNNALFIRGKFLKNDFNDGLITYPNFSTYDMTVRNNRNGSMKFGSRYNPNQDFLIAPKLDFISEMTIIKAEEGFQRIESLDVDGNGVDEVVKINFNGTSGSKTTLKITIYSFSNPSTFSSRSFNVDVEGIVKDKKFISPISRSYYFGDFQGSGKVQLLTVSHSKTFRDDDRTSYFALIDLDAGKLLDESTLFSHRPDEMVFVADVNGDGKAELCWQSPNTLEAYTLSLSTNTFHSLFKCNIPKNENTLYADLNGDGMIDIITPPKDSHYTEIPDKLPIWVPLDCPTCGVHYPIRRLGEKICVKCKLNFEKYYLVDNYGLHCRICTAPLFFKNASMNTFTKSFDQLYCPNQHPYLSPVDPKNTIVDNGKQWEYYLATGKGYTHHSTTLIRKFSGGKYCLLDLNRDGKADLIEVWNKKITTYMNVNGEIRNSPDIAPVSIDPLAKIVPANIINNNMISYLICVNKATVSCYSFTKDESKNHLLTSMTDSYGVIRRHSYANMVSCTNYLSTSTIHSYPYHSFIAPLNLLLSTDIYNNNTRFSEISYTYFGAVTHNTGLGFCGFEKVRIKDYISSITTEEEYNPKMFGVKTKVTSPFIEAKYSYDSQLDNTTKKQNIYLDFSSETDNLTNTTRFINYDYDAYNHLTCISTALSDKSVSIIETQTYLNSATPELYLTGQPLVKTIRTRSNGLLWTTKEEVTYNSSRLPISKTNYTGVDGNRKVNETRWEYNSDGNMTSEKFAPYNNTLFLGKTYTYDITGRYITSETNALGHTTTYSNFNIYGMPTIITDHKGNITRRVFDTWGQLVSVTSPDGVNETVKNEWGGAGLYTVATTTTGKPSTIVHYDATGREIRKGQQCFDGQWLYTDKTYDRKGNIEKVSMPYKTNPSLWNTYTYDWYNRPLTLTEASGKMTEWWYSGKETQVTTNGTPSTKIIDGAGRLIYESDLGGTIKYDLRPDGQLNSITTPGNVTTTFKYKDYGQRIMMSDPSIGTQLYEQSYNNNRKIETYGHESDHPIETLYDIYGRVSEVRRFEFDTSYTYNADGLLVSDVSTNGTSHTFSYDQLGRKTVERETAPDGKFLQKTYTYHVGNIATISYTSQAGIIGTEHFIYANGHHIETKLNDTLSIWKLTAENELGQPTQAQTGILARSYSYDIYGMLTGRKAGKIQDFSYQFDIQTGNLLSRTDNTRNLKETFDYDKLNRLTTINNQTIRYADNGNILSMPNMGELTYGNSSKPYQVTELSLSKNIVPKQEQHLTYTSFQRPNTIIENGDSAVFTYSSTGDRVKMLLMKEGKILLSRYYFGEQYEIDVHSGIERLYLNGDAYSAPAVYIKEGSAWKIYYICRDYLGSITHIVNADGSLKQELSYNAWGLLRNPKTQVTYTPGEEPELFLGRGYTGHEHLTYFGLINMNARLYDPILGRFLSPDPYVQMPDFTQSFNRYSYCVNNPLRYMDKNGKFWFLPAIIAFVVNYTVTGLTTKNWGFKNIGKSLATAAISMISYGVGMGVTNFLSNATALSQGALSAISAGIAGSVSGATTSLLNGGSIGQGALIGLASGLIGNALSYLNINNIWLEGAINIGSGGLIGGATSTIVGGNFWDGFKIGAISSAIGWGVSKGFDYVKNRVARNELQKKVEQYLGLSNETKTEQMASPFTKAKQESIPNMTAEKWEKIGNIFNSINGKYGTNFRISQNFDIFQRTYKFGNLHLRYNSSKNLYTYHYDGRDIIMDPFRHLILDTLYQGLKHHNW